MEIFTYIGIATALYLLYKLYSWWFDAYQDYLFNRYVKVAQENEYITASGEFINCKADHTPVRIGNIETYYGYLLVRVQGGRAEWCIEDGQSNKWEEIPNSLYKELIKLKNDNQ